MSHYVYGKNTVKLLLGEHPKRVFKIFVAEGIKPDKRIDAIYGLANQHGIAVQTVPRIKLDQMLQGHADRTQALQEQAGGRVETPHEEGPAAHQGVIASVAPKQLLSLSQLLEKCQAKQQAGSYPRLLMLDGVTDPRNFGAILRVCDAAGVDGVIVTKHKSAGFGPAVSKTASGAEETVDVCVVANLSNTLKSIKDAGFWSMAATGGAGAVPYYKQDYTMATVLVMGSEGKGIAPVLEKHCDFRVTIPMHGAVDSLNVATAAAVLLFGMVHPQK